MTVFAASRRSKSGHVFVKVFACQEIFALKSCTAAIEGIASITVEITKVELRDHVMTICKTNSVCLMGIEYHCV